MTLDVDDEPAPPAPAAAPVDDWPHEPSVMVHGGFVRAMICLVVVLVLGMATLIFIRSQSVEEPTSAVLVLGDSYLSGAEIAVYADGREIVKTKLDSAYEWSTPVLLVSGAYEVVVTLHDEELIRQAVSVPSMRMRNIDLPTSIVVQGDESLAGAEVTISGGEHYRRDVLTVPNDGTLIVHRSPGNYHVIISRNGKVLRDVEFTLRAHQPMVIHPRVPLEADGVSEPQ